jgi:UDP-N-acetylmuramyl pentapeptide phosphotransferase/UDP-N-acetylglucosamine-1-phosphate transferase
MTNLYNFMDGSDGLAGGMAAIGFGTLAVAAGLAGESSLAALCATVSLSALAFLHYNFPPARIFMGDAGSIPLGLMAASLGILGTYRGVWSWLFPLLIFSPFIADASITLVRRGLRGERVWHAHREHYYQRVVLMGLSHRRLALAAYALMLANAALALWLLTHPTHTIPVLGLWAGAYLLIILAIQRRWRVSGRSP